MQSLGARSDANTVAGSTMGQNPQIAMAQNQASQGAAPAGSPPQSPVSMSWFLKRMFLAVFIITLSMGSVAWLTYASIDQSQEGTDIATPVALAPEAVAAPVR